MQRRDVLKSLAAGGLLWQTPSVPRGLSPAKITDIRVILTAPNRIRLVIVKIITSEPGLYGVGCATFTQRALVVQTAVEQYLRPFLIGKNVDDIEDIWQSSYVSSYWRNGGVLFNAMSGVDQALWDIKGKRANMPVYQLLGGKCRAAADTYFHASGRDFQEVENSVRGALQRGYRHVRIQVAVPGQANYGVGGNTPQATWEPAKYVRTVPKLFAHIRNAVGEDVELLHDMHERVSPPQAVQLCKDLEQFKPYFVEDPLPPEETDHFKLIRQQCATPIAMGELFNNQHEYVPLISGRLIDFIRCHLSQIGGLSMARKIGALCEFFGVKTAYHGPGDTSPVGHAAQLHLELASYNFGIHEGYVFPPETRETFPGCPELKNGYLYANDAPGLGIDVDEKVAARFPYPPGNTFDHSWGETRKPDGTVIRP